MYMQGQNNGTYQTNRVKKGPVTLNSGAIY